jgi:hypothetical protein
LDDFGIGEKCQPIKIYIFGKSAGPIKIAIVENGEMGG